MQLSEKYEKKMEKQTMPFIWCSQEQHKGNFYTEMIKLAIQTHTQTNKQTLIQFIFLA